MFCNLEVSSNGLIRTSLNFRVSTGEPGNFVCQPMAKGPLQVMLFEHLVKEETPRLPEGSIASFPRLPGVFSVPGTGDGRELVEEGVEPRDRGWGWGGDAWAEF